MSQAINVSLYKWLLMCLDLFNIVLFVFWLLIFKSFLYDKDIHTLLYDANIFAVSHLLMILFMCIFTSKSFKSLCDQL